MRRGRSRPSTMSQLNHQLQVQPRVRVIMVTVMLGTTLRMWTRLSGGAGSLADDRVRQGQASSSSWQDGWNQGQNDWNQGGWQSGGWQSGSWQSGSWQRSASAQRSSSQKGKGLNSRRQQGQSQKGGNQGGRGKGKGKQQGLGPHNFDPAPQNRPQPRVTATIDDFCTVVSLCCIN